VSDSKSEEWVLKQIEDHGLGPILFAAVIFGGAGFVAGYVVSWFHAQRKAQHEIEKIKLELRKASGDITKELASLRKEFIQERELVDLSLREIHQALIVEKEGKKNPAELRTCYDQMCSIYVNRYLPALTVYVESIAVLCTQPDSKVRAVTEIIPGLKTMCRFLDMANLEQMLSKCGSSGFKLRKESRDGLFMKVRILVPWRSFRLRWQLYNLRTKTAKHLRVDD
jgi:hypothetical protein